LVAQENTEKDLWIRRGRFHFETRRAISAPKLEDPDREVAQPLGGIGGLYKNMCASYRMYEEGSVSVDCNNIGVIGRIEEESNNTTNIIITIF
jgi:hypothetical protein